MTLPLLNAFLPFAIVGAEWILFSNQVTTFGIISEVGCKLSNASQIIRLFLRLRQQHLGLAKEARKLCSACCSAGVLTVCRQDESDGVTIFPAQKNEWKLSIFMTLMH